MNVIFLDIDGVLNSTELAVACHHLKLSQFKGYDKMSIVAVGLLKYICDISNASIVVSSTWRIGKNIDWFKQHFFNLGWDNFPIIGMTKVTSSCRGVEIQMWLKEHPEITNYVILDDDSDMLKSQQSNFVYISGVTGLTLDNALKALSIFGKQNDKDVTDLQNIIDFKPNNKLTNKVWMVPVIFNGVGTKVTSIDYFNNPSYSVKYVLPEDQDKVDTAKFVTDNFGIKHYPKILSD